MTMIALLYRTVADHLVPWTMKLATAARAWPQHAGAAGAFDRRLCRRAGHSPSSTASARASAHSLARLLAPGGADCTEFTPSPPNHGDHDDRRIHLPAPRPARDAIFSGVAALGFTFGASAFATLFNLPEALLRETGLFLIAYTALVGCGSPRAALCRNRSCAVVIGKRGLDGRQHRAAVLGRGIAEPRRRTHGGAQAIATGVFAELQYVGARRARALSRREQRYQ